MKFIKCMYASFENSILGVAWMKGDIIALTKKLATSPVIMDGINTRNFVFVDVNTLIVLSKVVNVTPAITKDFKKRLVAEDEARMEAAKAAAEATERLSHPVPEDKGVRPAPPPEPEPEPEPEPPKEEEKVPEDTPQEDEKTEEDVPEGDGDSAEDKTEDPKEEEKVIAFTEIAGNVAAAVLAVEKETDIQKLKDALKLDERVTVTNAVVARLEELEG